MKYDKRVYRVLKHTMQEHFLIKLSFYLRQIDGDLDEDDLALVEENTGMKIQRPEVLHPYVFLRLWIVGTLLQKG